MADPTATHYELARALIRYEAGDLDQALDMVRDATRLVSDDPRLTFRVQALEAALRRQASSADAAPLVARAYQDVVAELRTA